MLPRLLLCSAYVRLPFTLSRAYAMGMPAQQTEWTAEMARALPDDGQRYEVLDGALFVSPAPSPHHQKAVMALLRRLDPYVRTNGLGETLPSPADIEFSSRRLVQPDVFVVPASAKLRDWRDVTSLLLAAEVLSPSTARADRLSKRVIYQSQQVPESGVGSVIGAVHGSRSCRISPRVPYERGAPPSLLTRSHHGRSRRRKWTKATTPVTTTNPRSTGSDDGGR